MEQWGTYLFDIASWTMALVATFEGARRIANGRRTRRAVLLLVVGVAYCALKGGMALYVSHMMDSMAETGRYPPTAELSHDWGAQLPPPERERASLARAAVAFNSSGRLLDYFNQAGERRPFNPSQEQLRQREATVELWQRVENTSIQGQSQGLRWLLSVVVALIVGIAAGVKNDG